MSNTRATCDGGVQCRCGCGAGRCQQHWQTPHWNLLPQTRRHSLCLPLLRVDSIVFAVNKLDAVENAEFAFSNIVRH
jgi:translation elongation factor EF-1alpha